MSKQKQPEDKITKAMLWGWLDEKTSLYKQIKDATEYFTKKFPQIEIKEINISMNSDFPVDESGKELKEYKGLHISKDRYLFSVKTLFITFEETI